MATTPRSSSPASSVGSPEQPQLSPRAQLNALLAAGSDDEDSPSQETTKAKSPRRKQDIDLTQLSTQNEDASDEESEEEIRPRGRLASRMQAVSKAPQSAEATTNNKETTARDRVRKMFELEKEAQKEQNVDMPDAQSEEDDLPVAPRRLFRRAPQSPAANGAARASRGSSPALFVSSPIRPSPTKSTRANSDSDSEGPLPSKERLKALAERKAQENRAKEAAEEARKAERLARQEELAQELEQMASDDNDSGITDDEGGRRLTQTDRPKIRKASKKAIEEMNRETQRMARNMQLTHEAKTRKKITKNSLFERFNYRPAGEPEPKVVSSSRGATPHSDVEMQDAETPPSSPPVAKKAAEPVAEELDEDMELPNLDNLAESTKLKLDKGKGKAIDIPDRQQPTKKPRRQVRVRLPPTRVNVTMLDSDDELEITTTVKDRVRAVFDNVPSKKAREPNSIHTLKALAQVKSPGKETRRRDDHGMTAGELQTYLQQKARQQARVERERRIEMLKAQGVVIQTAEERERQMQEVDDIVAKAREEAQKIMQEERAAAKKEKKDNGEVDPLAWDDSDDEEYQASGNEADTEASAVELSGSEEEDEESDEEAEGNPLLEAEAEDAESEASDDAEDSTPLVSQDVHDDADDLPVLHKRRTRKPVALISDDEDEDIIESTPKAKTAVHTSPTVPNTQSPAAPTSVLRSAKKTFIPGLPVQGPAGLGLTQIFAGTMDDSQMDSANGPTQSMMPDFDHFPDSNFSATMDEPMEDMIMDSQKDDTQKTTQGVKLNFSQSQMRGLDSLLREESTQLSEMIELSQDSGLQDHTPLKDRFIEVPVSTVDTMMVDPEEAGPDSPLVRRGRLRRRMETPLRIEETPEPTAVEKTNTAFSKLKEGAEKEKKRKAQEAFDHKKSKAKEMVEEQAEESEDEYAGLGGADGEDSDNESVASLKAIIDDAAGNDVDEAKLAAFYADRERAEDEKQVEKLFKDITTGMLRRKRGAGYDLDDSDDDGEARRRMKRRQFAKMQKALFADERVKKIAENPGNQAFLRTIEDRGSDDEMDFLDVPEETNESSQQSQSQEEVSNTSNTVPDSQPRKTLGSADNRAPAHMRRTKDGKKPSNIGEVRETLSNLLEEPHGSVIPATEAGSDSEGEEATPHGHSEKENDGPNPRRGRVAVVDRISLKRNNSSSVSAGRMAFASSSTSSFKVPALLRRATTNSLVSGSTSTTSSGTSTPSSGFGEEAKIKKGATKKSGVHAFARDSERRAKLEESERRREERKVKGAERRIGVVGGLLGKGTFE
ncbi:hypothetical protein N0V84_010029 [Fusarium piperis]|uniref:DNA replication checkpoint mediator MRC1 domain-containing protein n=1 Tax=Fusarium piperis TaxID=1435070 RepID=A0A9W8W590_9HYPO|nr:hypothetical protein N0V84_010029 [Fusarium piperis]